ncbi:MAG: ABC transporter permease [Candidatus Hydrogenedentes bacterium]|nr:ABC transporter permease [Candidatus Hydrogenedentota bacterium]
MPERGRSFAGTRRLVLTFAPLLSALVLELIVFEVLGRRQGVPGFASVESLIAVLNQSAVLGIMAVGMTFVIITGGIDLSVGSIVALSGVLCAMIVQWGGSPAWLWLIVGMGAALLSGAAAGAVAGALVTRFAIPPFIATLALMSSLRGLANLITDGKPISDLPDSYMYLGRHHLVPGLPLSVLLILGIIVAGAIALNHTRFGRQVLAIGGNEEAARLSGVPVRRVKFFVYLICGVLSALAGVILSSRLGSGSPKVGVADELAVIAAVVVGGTSLSGGRGSIGGTLVGLLVVAVLNSGLTWIGVETFGQQVVLGLVILGAVMLDRLKGGV